jgi:glycerol-3-phosphate acyltransferase PlsX
MSITIAIDAVGGDKGAPVAVDAARMAGDTLDDIELILIGTEEELRAEFTRAGLTGHPRVRIHHASQRVEMDDSAAKALRFKKDSSMRVATNLVKAGDADACISAGNTGAFMATARFVFKTIPGIERPAICSAMPTTIGMTHVLDLGANVDCTPNQLLQFGMMGSVLAAAVVGIDNPKVGLLNIGEEEMKGNEKVKEAGRLLAASDLNYIGYVEGNDIFKGTSDVVVCEGFVGNVALKSSEGVAQMIGKHLKASFMRTPLTRLAGLMAKPVLNSFKQRFDPRMYNGASLLGLRGIAVKSHGGADAFAFYNAIKAAKVEVEQKVPEHIQEHLGDRLGTPARAPVDTSAPADKGDAT